MTATKNNTLTNRQQAICDFIVGFTDTRGYPPTVREIASDFGLAVNCVRCHLNAIRKKGKVTWVENHARTLRVVEVAQ